MEIAECFGIHAGKPSEKKESATLDCKEQHGVGSKKGENNSYCLPVINQSCSWSTGFRTFSFLPSGQLKAFWVGVIQYRGCICSNQMFEDETFENVCLSSYSQRTLTWAKEKSGTETTFVYTESVFYSSKPSKHDKPF